MDPSARAPARGRAGFTLVELLVVVGTIALLVSILLPALNSARGQAKTVACLANLRGVGQIPSIYATQCTNQVPTGVMYDRQDWGYVAFSNGRYGPWGTLIASRLVGDGRALYCPEQPDSADETYNADTNWWVTEPGPEPMDDLNKLKGKAIASDYVRLVPRHGGSTRNATGRNRGLTNVLYADGHAVSVPYSEIFDSVNNPTANLRWLRPTEYNWGSGQFSTQPQVRSGRGPTTPST